MFIPGTTVDLPKTPRAPGLMRLYGSMSEVTFESMADVADSDDLATVFPQWAVEATIVDTFWHESPGTFYAERDEPTLNEDGEELPIFRK